MRVFWSVHPVFGPVLAAAVMAAVCFSGCVDVEYVGQQLPPEEVGTVAIFDSSDLVPSGVYGVLGRARVIAPEGCTMVDLREKLEEKAAGCGADAVEIVRVFKRKVGVSYRDGGGVAETPQAIQDQNVSTDGTPVYTDSFGKNTTLRTETVNRYETVINALFLAKKERLAKYIRNVAADAATGVPTDAPKDGPTGKTGDGARD